jgi:hypothetical protein
MEGSMFLQHITFQKNITFKVMTMNISNLTIFLSVKGEHYGKILYSSSAMQSYRALTLD